MKKLKTRLERRHAAFGTAANGGPDAQEQAFVDKHTLDVTEGATATTGAHVFRALTPAQRAHIITGIGGGESGREAELMHQCAESGGGTRPQPPTRTGLRSMQK